MADTSGAFGTPNSIHALRKRSGLVFSRSIVPFASRSS
jgi:hypothetical protein